MDTHTLSGEFRSIPNANGDHTPASLITDLIARQTGKTLEQAIRNIRPDTANGEAEIAAFLAAISDPDNYLDGGLSIESLTNYFAGPQNSKPSDSQVQS